MANPGAKKKKKKKKKSGDDDAGGADFMMLFTALSVILLAFFILLCTMAVIDDSKKRLALGSLRGSFGILPGGNAFDKDGKSVVSSAQISSDIVILEEMLEVIKTVLATAGNEVDGADIALDRTGMYPRLVLAGHLVYAPGGRALAPRAFPILDVVAAAVDDLGAELDIEGHTTLSAANGLSTSNWELSAARADNVGRYFVDAAGIDPKLVRAQGVAHYRGGDQPRDTVVIVFRYDKTQHGGTPDRTPPRKTIP